MNAFLAPVSIICLIGSLDACCVEIDHKVHTEFVFTLPDRQLMSFRIQQPEPFAGIRQAKTPNITLCGRG